MRGEGAGLGYNYNLPLPRKSGDAEFLEALDHAISRIQAFAPFGLTWTGGAIGLLAAQLTYWKLQTQDWWRERALA